jgi:hypothetical protein
VRRLRPMPDAERNFRRARIEPVSEASRDGHAAVEEDDKSRALWAGGSQAGGKVGNVLQVSELTLSARFVAWRDRPGTVRICRGRRMRHAALSGIRSSDNGE